jgi:MFS family permease
MGTLLNRAARDALLPAIVPAANLAEAVAWNSSSYQMAAVAGPALAGGLIAWTKTAQSVYLFNLGCIVASIVLVLAIRARPVAIAARARSLADLFGGVVHVWREKVVLGLVAIDLCAMLLGTVTALLPIYAKDILGAGPEGLGLLTAAPAIGAFAMALVQGVRRPYRRAGPAFLWAIATYGIAMIVFGLSPWFWLSFAVLVVAGAADNIGAIVRMTVIQLHTPDALRGRVSAVNRVLISASNELGATRAGLLAAATGATFTVLAGGVGGGGGGGGGRGGGF